jgi:hypothetical protein
MELTNKDFLDFKKRLGFSNDDIAIIVDIKPGSVKNQSSLKRDRIPTWARAMLFMERKNKKRNEQFNQIRKALMMIENKLDPNELGSNHDGNGWLEKHLYELGEKKNTSIDKKIKIK